MIKVNTPIFNLGKFAGCLLVFFMLSACDRSGAVDELERYEKEMQNGSITSDDNGQLLNEVAGRSIAPSKVHSSTDHSDLMRPEALAYVGRYHVSVGCDDPLAMCEDGSSEFILNLLPDGTAHRTINHLGAITFESKRQYQQDRWTFEPELNQITLHRANGVKFFYQVADQKLVMDRDKIRQGTQANIDYFDKGGAFPSQVYVLQKIAE